MRFHKISSGEMFESETHAENGVSIGNNAVFYVEDLGDYLERHSQPRDMILSAAPKQKPQLFNLLCKLGDLGNPDWITVKPGLRTNRIYISCCYI